MTMIILIVVITIIHANLDHHLNKLLKVHRARPIPVSILEIWSKVDKKSFPTSTMSANSSSVIITPIHPKSWKLPKTFVILTNRPHHCPELLRRHSSITILRFQHSTKILKNVHNSSHLIIRVRRDPGTRPVPNFFSSTRPVPTRKLKMTGTG